MLWLNRKFLTGYLIWPFSMYQTPSRVNPVTRAVLGSTPRMYQKRVTINPRAVFLIISSKFTGGAELSRMALTGPGVGSLPSALPRNANRRVFQECHCAPERP